MEGEHNITIIDMDGGKHTVESKLLDMSEYLKAMKDNGGIKDDTIVLNNIKASCLDKIIEFCNYHINNPFAEIEKPLKSSNMRDIVSEWDATFIDIPVEELMDLIVAGNFLIIQPFLDLACAKVASLIKGKSPEDIRSTFNIESDFTPEEEAKIREENKWSVE